MPNKPFYSSLQIIVLLPLLVVLVNFALIIILGMETYDSRKIDKLLHVAGGMSVSISAAGILWKLNCREIISVHNSFSFRLLVFGFLCFMIISWEVFEYVFFLPMFGEYLTYSDTVSDMLFGMVGGLLTLPLFRKPVCL